MPQGLTKRRLKDGLSGVDDKGFTLIEMVAAIAISAILLGILSEFLYSGISLSARYKHKYRLQQQLRMIYQTLDSDFAQLYPGAYLSGFAFTGDERQLSFWQEATAGEIQISYRYEAKAGQIFRGHCLGGGAALHETVLFSGIAAWRFEYYQPKSGNWLPIWAPNSLEKDSIPALIRVSLRTKLGNQVAIVFPLKSWHAEVDSGEN